MKRVGERDMESPQKRARNLGSYELRLLIPSRVAGSIIGKGGSNISRLRTENKATINVPDCPGPERLVSISADDQETTLNVLVEIVPIIEEASKEPSRGSEGVEIRTLYHHSQVGCIIGKAGAKIKELRESTSAQIKVYCNCCPRSTDRVVAVSGSSEMVLNAIKQIVALVNEQSPLKGPNEPYDPHNYDEIHAVEYGGYGKAMGGAYGRGPGPSGGMGDRFRGGPMDGGGGGGGGRMMGGPPRGPPPRFRDDSGYGFSQSHFQDGSNGGGWHEDYERDYEEDRQSTQVTIPLEYAGAIIGRGGSRIRRIREESGASITIGEAVPGATERIITIAGASGQIRMAQYLLQQSVKEHGDRGKAF